MFIDNSNDGTVYNAQIRYQETSYFKATSVQNTQIQIMVLQ